MICKQQVVQRNKDGRYYVRPCGQCLNCRINDMRRWFVRSFFECKKKERPFQYFLTLTFSDDNLPVDNLCTKRELKLFLNNLNTSFGLHMRYFATSDYGMVHGRPHYHAIILSTKKITSAQVLRIWKKGFVTVKELKPFRIKYILRYTVKKIHFDMENNSDEKKGYFRLISKGWGNNVKDYYHGQEYFVIDGRKYGIDTYCASKIGLDKKEVVTHLSYESLVNSPDFQNVGHFNDFVDDLKELEFYRRKCK
nr:unnamed protein product [uncultured bacterium]